MPKIVLLENIQRKTSVITFADAEGDMLAAERGDKPGFSLFYLASGFN